MLAIIQDQQHLFGSHKVQEQLIERLVGHGAQIESLGNMLWDEFWLAQRNKVGQPDAVCKYILDIIANLDSKPRLAASPSPCQGNEARSRDQAFNFCQSALTTDKARQ